MACGKYRDGKIASMREGREFWEGVLARRIIVQLMLPMFKVS